MKAKRKIYLRVGAGLLALWLGFFGAFAVWQLMRLREAAMKEYMAIFDNASVSIAETYAEYENNEPGYVTIPVESQWDINANVNETLQGVKYSNEMELACYDFNGDVIAQTGPYLTLGYEMPPKSTHRKFGEIHCGILDVYSALPKDAADKLVEYASYWDPIHYQDAEDFRKNAEIGHVNSYVILFPGGLWTDGQYLIPGKIVVCAEQIYSREMTGYQIPQFDDAGNLVEEGNLPIVWTYENEPPAEQIAGMTLVQPNFSFQSRPALSAEYPEHKARVLDEYWSSVAKGAAWNDDWGEGGQRIMAPGQTQLKAKGLITTNYISVNETYHNNRIETLLVASGTYHTLRESAKILGPAAAGSGALLLMVGLLLCWQLGRVYEAQAALEAQRRRITNAIAHDLKTPMAAVMAYAENLLEDTQPQKRDHYLRAIHSQVGRMDEIVRRMLELSRLEAGVDQLNRTEFSLGELCRQAAEEQPGLVLVSGDETISADREMLRRVLDNLLSNALKHAAPGTAVTVAIEDGRLEVSNVGEPIPEDKLDQLWEPYYQADEARSAGGSGLGLSIVREILRRHEFSYGTENRENMVVFWFRWT